MTAACATAAVSLVSAGARLPVAWCGVVATAAVAVVAAEAARRGRAIAALRERFAAHEVGLKRLLADQEAETIRLAEVVLPQAVFRLQQGEFAEDVLAGSACDTHLNAEFAAAHQAVLRSVVEAVKAEEDLRDSAQRAFVNIARRVQAIVHQQAQDLREMEDRHGNEPEVFGDLLHLDHGTALIGRLADSIAVLGGARPGRQWYQAVPLFSVLRGAMSRVIDYQRVELHSVSEVAVVGPAVEPLIHALAELLDNATRYSPPQTRVHLTATEVQAGMAIEIEDGGVGLTEEARGRAERVLKQASAGLDLADLGETPRLGLAVVGRLAQAHNFQVSLRPSAYGGVRAVLIVPQELITAAPAGAVASGHFVAGSIPASSIAAPAPRSVGTRTPTGPVRNEPVPPPGPVRPEPAYAGYGAAGLDQGEQPLIVERNANGLPQRRRRHTADAVRPAAPVAAPQAQAPAEPQVQPGLWLAAFQSGVSGETPAAVADRRISDETLDKGESS